jgi:hypothetical protein
LNPERGAHFLSVGYSPFQIRFMASQSDAFALLAAAMSPGRAGSA